MFSLIIKIIKERCIDSVENDGRLYNNKIFEIIKQIHNHTNNNKFKKKKS